MNELSIQNNEVRQITFADSTGEVLRITKGKFYAMGKEIDDIHDLYGKLLTWVNNQGL